MTHKLTFHPLVQRDLNEILAYYELEASVRVMILKHASRAPGYGLRRR